MILSHTTGPNLVRATRLSSALFPLSSAGTRSPGITALSLIIRLRECIHKPAGCGAPTGRIDGQSPYADRRNDLPRPRNAAPRSQGRLTHRVRSKDAGVVAARRFAKGAERTALAGLMPARSRWLPSAR